MAPRAGYLPREWAKLEIDRLLGADAVKHKQEIVALSKAMYVMTPYTSLLVLEHEDLYKQYKVDRGRKDHWALYPAPAKVPAVHEPGAAVVVHRRRTRRPPRPRPTSYPVARTSAKGFRRGGHHAPPAFVRVTASVDSARNLGSWRPRLPTPLSLVRGKPKPTNSPRP